MVVTCGGGSDGLVRDRVGAPLQQGSRLTAWELETAGIPHAVIADSAAGSMMAM